MRFIRDHKVWTALISLAFGCVIVTLSAHAVILREAAQLWIVSDSLEKPTNAIVVLDGWFDQRARAAAALYKLGYGRDILILHAKLENGSPDKGKSSPIMAELSRALLINLGVPEGAVIDVPGQASSTYEEAEFVSNLIRVTGAKSLIIPTNLFHTRRVKWTYNKLFHDKGIKVTVRPILPLTYSPETWWQSGQGRSEFAWEILAYLYYRIRY
jgi:uncharacterized SAM-binding protein YcdF (DUF218 family)